MDWSEEGADEEDGQTSLRRPRQRLPSPPRGDRPSIAVGGRTAYSVRTTRGSPRSSSPASPPAGAGDRGGGGAPTVEEIISSLRAAGERPRLVGPSDATSSSASIIGGGAAAAAAAAEAEAAEEDEEYGEFSFPSLGELPRVDAGHVLDRFSEAETERNAKARAEFLEATFGAGAGARTEEMKKELIVRGKVLDLAGLERWLRRVEATGELAWFTELCADEEKPVPPLELFECAFHALQSARSDELHRGADARRLWIGSVAVPELFLCPVSNKVMENPVVLTSGKTVDLAALQEWWKIHNHHKRVCPVTGDALMSSFFAPHILIASCISLWRNANGITAADLTAAAAGPAVSPEEQALFNEVTLLAYSPSCSERAYDAILRLLELVGDGEERAPFLHLLGRSPGTIAKLACILPETCLEPDPELDDAVLEIISMAASYGPNKEVIGGDRYAIPVLIARALLGPVPARARCAHILGMLADNYYNKIKIGELGGFPPLMELLAVGDAGVKRAAAAALASLCEAQENWSRFVREGVAGAAVGLIRKDGLVEEAQGMLLQAYGFELAMVEVMEALASCPGDRRCEELAGRLWNTFMRSKPGQRRAANSYAAASSSKAAVETSSSSSSSPSPSSSSSEGGIVEEPAGNGGLAGPSKKDVKTIVSWLEKKTYFPYTYRYRN